MNSSRIFTFIAFLLLAGFANGRDVLAEKIGPVEGSTRGGAEDPVLKAPEHQLNAMGLVNAMDAFGGETTLTGDEFVSSPFFKGYFTNYLDTLSGLGRASIQNVIRQAQGSHWRVIQANQNLGCDEEASTHTVDSNGFVFSCRFGDEVLLSLKSLSRQTLWEFSGLILEQIESDIRSH